MARKQAGETIADGALLRLVQEHAGDLLRLARRYSLCADDAQDAYQRALEVFMRRMRSDPPDHPLRWLQTVLKNEALAVRAQREQLLGREETDLDSHEDRRLDDPVERVASFERLQRTAEALQRLKPQELTALTLRAEGRTYREIAELTSWTYTKVNRAVTEGRRALLDRLADIETGAECVRWQPVLSLLADGEATARDVAELRPHLRTCPACRAMLRRFHHAPREVAALLPLGLAGVACDGGVGIARQVEAATHALLDRATAVAIRLQGALDAVPGGKLAAVAASTAALAGGGAAIEQASHRIGARPVAALSQSARRAAAGLPTIASIRPTASPAARAARPPRRPVAEFGVAPHPAPEFASEASGAGASARGAPEPRATAQAATAAQRPIQSSPPTPAAEFAGP